MISPTPSSRVDNDLARRCWASTWLPAHGHFPELQIHMDMGLLGRIAGMSPLFLSSSPSSDSHGSSVVVQGPPTSVVGLGPDLPTIMLLNKVG